MAALPAGGSTRSTHHCHIRHATRDLRLRAATTLRHRNSSRDNDRGKASKVRVSSSPRCLSETIQHPMVLQAAYPLVSNVIPSGYFWHIAGSLAVVVVSHAFAQGRTTNRERDLHARVILVTVRDNLLRIAVKLTPCK